MEVLEDVRVVVDQVVRHAVNTEKDHAWVVVTAQSVEESHT
jgi:hypothetical protein